MTFLFWVFIILGLLGIVVWALGIYYMIRDARKRTVTGHWVEHRHWVQGFVKRSVQPMTSPEAAQIVTADCEALGYTCKAFSQEVADA